MLSWWTMDGGKSGSILVEGIYWRKIKYLHEFAYTKMWYFLLAYQSYLYIVVTKWRHQSSIINQLHTFYLQPKQNGEEVHKCYYPSDLAPITSTTSFRRILDSIACCLWNHNKKQRWCIHKTDPIGNRYPHLQRYERKWDWTFVWKRISGPVDLFQGCGGDAERCFGEDVSETGKYCTWLLKDSVGVVWFACFQI